MHIKLRLYGESFRTHLLHPKDIPLEDLMDVAERLKEPIEEALLSGAFFNILNQKKLKTIEDMIRQTFGGLINTPKNKIEIWYGRKCLQKFSLNELFHPSTLFPLFNSTREQLDIKLSNGIFLIEKEVGLIAEYVFKCDSFNINHLKFSIYDAEYQSLNLQLLTAMHYDSKRLESQKSDTLITYRYCVFNIK